MHGRDAMRLRVAAVALALACSGCDGGGSSSPPPALGSVPTPTPTPSAGPVGTLPPGSQAFGTLGQTSPQEFAVLGFAVRGKDGGVGYNYDFTTLDTQAPIRLRLVAPGQLALSIGARGEGTMAANGAGGIDPQGRLMQMGYSVLGGVTYLEVVRLSDGTLLSSTGQGDWTGPFESSQPNPYLLTHFVYGVPTMPSAMPQSGIQTYRLSIGPSGSLTVDFTARSIGGTITLQDSGTNQEYTLQDVVFTSSTEFKGRLASRNLGKFGEIQGRFTGATGAEIMGRYVIPAVGSPNVPAWTFTAARQQ